MAPESVIGLDLLFDKFKEYHYSIFNIFKDIFIAR
jgi:hypothetical protein